MKIKGSGVSIFEKKIFEFIKKNKLLTPRGLILVGVSGGADSMALLVALNTLRHVLGIQLQAVHFNHRFRPEAVQDEQFVAQWCQKLNIPLTIGRRAGQKIKKLSEDDARQMRFKFFVKTSTSLKAQAVALAHTRNDLAETVLMRLIRGSGLYGLRGILPQRSMDGVNFIRPFVATDRQDIENYLKMKKIPFCQDATNDQMIYERNRIRHELLPLLARQYNPQITGALTDFAASAIEDYEYLSVQASRPFKKIVTVSKHKIKMQLKGIRQLHPAMLRLVLRQMVEKLTQDPSGLTFEHIHALENLVSQSAQGRIDLPHQMKAVKTKEFLELYYD